MEKEYIDLLSFILWVEEYIDNDNGKFSMFTFLERKKSFTTSLRNTNIFKISKYELFYT